MADPDNLISRAAFALLARRSNAAITIACREGGRLHASVVGKAIDVTHPDAEAYLQARGVEVPVTVTADMRRGQGRPSVPGAGAKAEKSSRAAKPKPKAPPRKREKPAPKPAAPKEDKPPLGSYDRPTGRRAAKEAAKAQPLHPPKVHRVPDNIAEFADMTLRDLIDQFGTDLRFSDWLKALKAIEDIREKRIKNAEREGELVSRDLVRTHVIGAFERAHINLLTDGSQTIATRLAAMVRGGSDEADCQKFVSDTISRNIRSVKATVGRALRDADQPAV